MTITRFVFADREPTSRRGACQLPGW